ncbi:putative RING-H2 finger protein ATL21A [Jatropha curcas]|uniref:putative RING-H2 finger protein ATL21A n=1 Tax=Jatropha curcas TaxID=180498 RepID=UPI0009D6F596|nr:putative RING-H2 finger protein ATL21A [Jatropha curcas]
MSIANFILFVLVLVYHGQSLPDPNCSESSCGAGPVIRFPFRLRDKQLEHCGYAGFDLSCTEKNQTLLELPNSVKLFVKTVDYQSQVINVSHPDDCFLRQALNIDFSASPFSFRSDSLDDYTLFNCSTSIQRNNIDGNISCLSVPGYEVYA